MKPSVTMSLAALALSISASSSIPSQAEAFPGRVIEFRSGPDGFDTNTYFYEGLHEVIAFDAQFTPELAKKSIAHLRQYTRKPISWLVLTHPNPDKFNGASVFKAAGAHILASTTVAEAIPGVHAYKEYFFVEIAQMFKRGEYPQPVPVDHTFSGAMDLILRGGEQIKLIELAKPGVSSTQTVAYIPSGNSLFVGDLIHYKAHAWLEGGIVGGTPVPTLEGWVDDLQQLLRTFPSDASVYGGRGSSVNLGIAVAEQIHYLKTAQLLVRQDLIEWGSRAKDYLSGPQAGLYYKALAEKFQQQFPDYELPYMIEYGAYGLVQQELQNLQGSL